MCYRIKVYSGSTGFSASGMVHANTSVKEREKKKKGKKEDYFYLFKKRFLFFESPAVGWGVEPVLSFGPGWVSAALKRLGGGHCRSED